MTHDEGLDQSSLASDASRRGFLLAGLGVLLTGCATDQAAESLANLPGPDLSPTASNPGGAGNDRMQPIYRPQAAPPTRGRQPAAPRDRSSAVITRSQWATGDPVPALMNRMRPIRYVTVHHDGMHPFFGNDARSAAWRLDAIRRAHRGKKWGDIGYHYAIDRGGRIWEARPLGYQGAHVKDHNEGNVGIVVLGNFDRQQPTDAQIEGLRRQLSMVMRTYRIPARNLRTHQEWAATACPGKHVQHYVYGARSNGAFG